MISAGGRGNGPRAGTPPSLAGIGANPREMPQQGSGERDAAYQQRVSNWGAWEQANVPRSQQIYGDKTQDFYGPNAGGQAMNWMQGRQGNDSYRAMEQYRNNRLNSDPILRNTPNESYLKTY